LLHVAEPTPARGRFEAGIEVVGDVTVWLIFRLILRACDPPKT
jgi:hypothetical protein